MRFGTSSLSFLFYVFLLLGLNFAQGVQGDLMGTRPPPPMAAPPLTPPERRKQLVKRSTGVACGAVAASVAMKRSVGIKTKMVAVGAMAVVYLLGDQVAGVVADMMEPAPSSYLHNNNWQEEKVPSKRHSNSQHTPTNTPKPDVWVDDVEREKLKRHTKTLKEKVFFWKKAKPEPIQEEVPTAPKWSAAYEKKQDYEEDYGI